MLVRTVCIFVGMVTGGAMGITFYDWKIAQHGVQLSNQLNLPFEVSIVIRVFFILILLILCGVFVICCPRERDLKE